MRKRFRDLTEKYKLFRLQPDVIYLSRTIQTLFNKFTKKGKKALARRHLHLALENFRYTYKRTGYNLFLRILRNLRVPITLIAVRHGRTIESVPVPVRRNKRNVLNIQILYKAIRARREQNLNARVEQELVALTTKRSSSATVRAQTANFRKIYEERVNIGYRWR